jgi:uncharacterized protein (TIGR03437 family)
MKNTPFLLVLTSLAALGQTSESIPFRAVLSARSETTPVVDSNATGAVTVWVHVVRDAAGKVTSGSVDFSVNYRFSGATTLTAMHIHKAPVGVAGAIVVPVPLTRFDDATGAGTIPTKQVQFSNADASTTVLDSINGLLADPSQYYFNIHTVDAPAGAMRGQLQRAEMTVLMGMMSPANENPPIAGSAGSAVATVIALRTLDSNFNQTSGAVVFDINYSGFADATFTGLHVHLGGAAINGPVTIDSGISGVSSVAAGASGTGNLHYEFEVNLARAGAPDSLAALFHNPSATYINVHTTVSPGGAARSQLHRVDHAAIQINATSAEEVGTPPVSIDASAPGVIHVYTLRNPDGSVAAGSVIFDINTRFPAGTNITAMHIHDATAGNNGSVTIDPRLTGALLLSDTGTGNVYRLVTVTGGTALSSLNDLVQNPEKHYFNMHTSTYPAGAVRAQLGSSSLAAPSVGIAISAVSDVTRTVAANKSLMSIYGQRMARLPADLNGFLQLSGLPTTLNGTSVKVGGTSAGLVLVSPEQLIIEVPAEVPEGSQDLIVSATNGASSPFKLQVRPVSPNLFFDSIGGIVTKANFTLVRPESPAAAGDILAIYSTGNGQTTPALATGRVPPLDPLYNAPAATVTIGGQNAPVLYSVAAPGFPGLYQTGVRMPAGVPAGKAALQMTMGGVPSNTVNIDVR